VSNKAGHGNFFTNRYIVNNYILLDILGTGSYAEVRLSKEKSTEDQLYAIKIMNKDLLMKKSVGMASTFMDDVRREIAIMKRLRHDNVLRLFEVMDDEKVRSHANTGGPPSLLTRARVRRSTSCTSYSSTARTGI
jgi:serine/threonine protein kinase